jgi:hypothetical protein
MRKLTMGLKVGLLVVGLLATFAAPSTAQFLPPSATAAGFADPLTLATSGVLLPYFGTGNNISILEVAAPVDEVPLGHMIFYNAACSRIESRPLPLTTNDVEVRTVAAAGGLVPVSNQDGLVAIANTFNQLQLFPLVPHFEEALHSRMYWINVNANRFRVLEPIILQALETWDNPLTTWSPIRTGATFFAPQESQVGIQTTLYLICPKATIQGAPDAAFPTTTIVVNGREVNFPDVGLGAGVGFKTSYPIGSLAGVVYDDDENPLADISVACDCLTTKVLSGAGAISTIYTQHQGDTYTELVTDGTFAGFTGYKALTFAGIDTVDFFGRLSNGNRNSLTDISPPIFPIGFATCGNDPTLCR